MEEYKTVEFEASDYFIEKKSKFIGYVKPVITQNQAIDFVNSIKSKHWDATHNVYAYILRENNIQRYSDDGEPSGTAGVPVLDVLLKESLCDVCVVATRYFGGTLLGAGGLVRAYSHTSKIAVEAGKIITMAQCCVMQIFVDYNFYDKVMTLLSDYNCNIIDTVYSDNVMIKYSIKENISDLLNEKIIDASNGRYASEFLYTKFDKS